MAEIPFFDNASHFRAISKKWSVEWGSKEEVGSVPQFRAGVRVPVHEWVKGMYFCLVLCVHHRNGKLFGWAAGGGGWVAARENFVLGNCLSFRKNAFST